MVWLDSSLSVEWNLFGCNLFKVEFIIKTEVQLQVCWFKSGLAQKERSAMLISACYTVFRPTFHSMISGVYVLRALILCVIHYRCMYPSDLYDYNSLNTKHFVSFHIKLDFSRGTTLPPAGWLYHQWHGMYIIDRALYLQRHGLGVTLLSACQSI